MTTSARLEKIAAMEASIRAGLHTPRTLELVDEYRAITDEEYEDRVRAARARSVSEMTLEAMRRCR